MYNSRQTPGNLKVRVGSTTHNRGGTIIQVRRIVQHQNYDDRAIDYDFSLLELENDIKLGLNAQAVKLPKQSERIPDQTHCIVTGWGNTQVTYILFFTNLLFIS